MQIKSVTETAHDNFFAISGSDFPDDVEIVFVNQGTQYSISPDFIRPHILLIKNLPTNIAVGNNSLYIEAGNNRSNSFNIEVLSNPRSVVQYIHPGASKEDPYTIVFVANPAIKDINENFILDPVVNDRLGFYSIVFHSFQNLFSVNERLLIDDNIDEQIRIVTIFDDSLQATDKNALAAEYPPNMMETRRVKLAPFLLNYQIIADLVFVIHGSTTHTRATAWYTSDDSSRASTPYTYDNVNRIHGHFPNIPGSATLPLSLDKDGLTVIHEFCHAASDFNNGRVNDLYYDGKQIGFCANKKWRENVGDQIPNSFSTYNGIQFLSEQKRDGLGYPSNWKSYHPESSEQNRPNLMDNYWHADQPRLCRLDNLTYIWLRDRLMAKLSR